jgi:hypothetical protein
MMRLVVVFGVILAAAAPAPAQTFVGAAVGASTQGEGASDQPYLGPPFGGASGAVVAMADFAPARNVAAGGEVSLAGAITGTQSQRASGGSNTFVSEHRDTVFSGTFKVGTPFDAPVRVAFVLGAGVAERHTARTGAFNPGFGLRPSTPFTETLTDWVPAFTVGADLGASLTRHVGLLGLARVHRLKDDDRLPDGVVKRGVSSAIVRLGGGVQLKF